MSSNGRVVSLICAMCAVAIACDSHRPGPVAPAAAMSAAAFSRSDGGPARASGHADIHGTTVQNIRDETYSFSAIAAGPAPLATGQVEVHLLQFTGEEATVHAEVTCMSVVGNQAWVGSRVTRFVFNGEELPQRVGTPMIFRVQDMGEGDGVIDLAALVFFAFPSDLTYCTTRPQFPILRESTIGNIQVVE